jgi:lipopolysaccharide transport system ATP-binding protein
MKTDLALEIRNLGKSYIIPPLKEGKSYKTLQEDIVEFIKKPFTKKKEKVEVWAIEDISADIAHGELVGIIGPNGAGKSTFLKVISRITEPSRGSVKVNGRIGALLEVGTGFHPELSGRENVFLSGAILGMAKSEIQKHFDEIVAFAEVEKFIDTPVKRYSSGMFLRLAFSVMAHLKSEILVVDEVLAVGDASFQKKCLGKMEGVSKQGRTVLFVSHNLETIAHLCPRSLLLHGGHLIKDGPSREVIDHYYQVIKQDRPKKLKDRKDRQGTGNFLFTDSWIVNEKGDPIDIVYSGQSIKIVLEYYCEKPEDLNEMLIAIGLTNPSGMFTTNFGFEERKFIIPANMRKKKGYIECIIPKVSLNAGTFQYNLMARYAGENPRIEDYIQRAGRFRIEPGPFFGQGTIVPEYVFMLMNYQWQVR